MSNHDTRSNSSRVTILGGFTFLVAVCLVGLVALIGFIASKSAEQGLIYIVDGCRVYKFLDEGETHYFATCENGVTATTYAGGTKHIPTEQL